MKRKIVRILLFIIALIFCQCQRIDKHEITCRVYSIEKQVKTSGSKESFNTDIYWLVTTDRGSYHIVTDGLWACPEAVGQIKADSIYTLTIDGWFESSFWGMYPYIVKVRK